MELDGAGVVAVGCPEPLPDRREVEAELLRRVGFDPQTLAGAPGQFMRVTAKQACRQYRMAPVSKSVDVFGAPAAPNRVLL